MRQVLPDKKFENLPCGMVAVGTAKYNEIIPFKGNMRPDGYITLNDMNRYIRSNLYVKKRTDYRRGQRPIFGEMVFSCKAIVCVKGHYIYVDSDDYYSFFDNSNDEVITIWQLR